MPDSNSAVLTDAARAGLERVLADLAARGVNIPANTPVQLKVGDDVIEVDPVTNTVTQV